MDQKTPVTVIDADIFVRDLRYVRDREYAVNKRFLELIQKRKSGVTTLFNLMEICGILSFNLNQAQIRELFYYFPEKYGIHVLPLHSLDGDLPELTSQDVFAFIETRMAFGDSLVASAVRRYVPEAGVFVSWNAKHFGAIGIKALTPRQFLQQYS